MQNYVMSIFMQNSKTHNNYALNSSQNKKLISPEYRQLSKLNNFHLVLQTTNLKWGVLVSQLDIETGTPATLHF